ncbi:hypothetical protein MMC25_000802 [Agyrium rufum]|nr:hypothetical protein [Agyrium rufum]
MEKSTEALPLRLENTLAQSRSPYVRAHMNNPVAWQTWNPSSLALAKQHNRLLFVSIGYAACHWCHVMEKESFMSPEVAVILNESFIPIKVDREERPDLDDIYMNYVQATTGSGGWPMNVFLTPDLQPVFGGTYWPGPNSSTPAAIKHESIGFLDILRKMSMIWQTQEEKCRTSAQEITRQLKQFAEEGVHSHRMGEKSDSDSPDGLEIDLLEEAYEHFQRKYDPINGGFSLAPKFPTPVNLSFLLRLGQWPKAVASVIGKDVVVDAASMAISTLRQMARGGIRDQIGFGFSRYSVTADWTLPHWEKMLYDQAQLLDVYLDAFILTADPEMLGAVLDIVTYLTSPPIAAPRGGFYCAEDADSLPTDKDTEKREGAYYVWTNKEFRSVLGDGREADICARFYGVLPNGNVEPEHDPHDELIGRNTLSVRMTPGTLSKETGIPEDEISSILKEGRRKLREYRDQHRPRPSLDDKIIVAWNGMAIGALARASVVLQTIDAEKAQACRQSAEKAVSFIRQELFDEETHKLWRIYREGRGDTPGFADDHAFLINGLIKLYEATFDDSYLQLADLLQRKFANKSPFLNCDPREIFRLITSPFTESQITNFLAPTGAFYTTPHTPPPSSSMSTSTSAEPQTSDLLLRLIPGMDNAEPSPNGISAQNLLLLSSLLSNTEYASHAAHCVQAFEAETEHYPFCYVTLLTAGIMSGIGVKGVVVCGDSASEGNEEDGAVEEDMVLGKARAGLGVGRTVARVGRSGNGVEAGTWLKQKNDILSGLKIREGKGLRVLVCEAGVCREGVEHL